MAHAPTTSLNRRSANDSSTDCTACGGDVTRIDMVRNGLELEFVSCSACDTRTWMRNGETVDIDMLLNEMVSAREQAAVVADQPDTADVHALNSVGTDLVIEQDAAFVADVVIRFVA